MLKINIKFSFLQKSPIDTRRDLYESIIISGGTSMFPGFSTRFESEMDKLY